MSTLNVVVLKNKKSRNKMDFEKISRSLDTIDVLKQYSDRLTLN